MSWCVRFMKKKFNSRQGSGIGGDLIPVGKSSFLLGDDTPVVNEGEDEGIGGEAEDDVPQVEGKVAEEHMEGQLGLGDCVVWRRHHRRCIQVKH